MATFIDKDYIKSRIRNRALIELTDDIDKPINEINESKLQTVINDVDARVKTVLRKHYVIPITQLGDQAEAYADSIKAIQSLCLRCVMHSLYQMADRDVPETYAPAYLELDTYETDESSLHGVRQNSQLAIGSSKSLSNKRYSDDTLDLI